MFYLVDCNNFFVSCERVFRPELKTQPVVVLSNNDGCFVSRSNEAKDIGLPMAAPAFKHTHTIKKHGVHLISANFPLYMDMAERVRAAIATVLPNLETYSIDEVFIETKQYNDSTIMEIGRAIKNRVLKWTGIPVSVGIGPTRTLAKLASEHAKKQEICFIAPHSEDYKTKLTNTKSSDVWGIGYGLYPKFSARGVRSALDVANLSMEQAISIGSITLARTANELRGVPCIDTSSKAEIKSASSTRTFATSTTDSIAVKSALARYIGRAAQQIRSHKLKASRMTLFVTQAKSYHGSRKTIAKTLSFPIPTNATHYLVQKGISAIQQELHTVTSCKRAGVTLSQLVPHNEYPQHLFETFHQQSKWEKTVNPTLDKLNTKWGDGTLYYAAEKLKNPHSLYRQQHRSPNYTTKWEDLPTV